MFHHSNAKFEPMRDGIGKADELAIIPVRNRRQRAREGPGARKISSIVLERYWRLRVSDQVWIDILLWFLLVGCFVVLSVVTSTADKWHTVVRRRQSSPSHFYNRLCNLGEQARPVLTVKVLSCDQQSPLRIRPSILTWCVNSTHLLWIATDWVTGR